MPIYEYRCEKCGREFEEWQRFSDPPVDACSDCGGKTRRLISQSSFVLKGTGWYVTDYARKDTGGGKAVAKAKETSEASSTAATTGSAGDS